MVTDAHAASLKFAIANGVKIAAGCDIFVSGQMYGESSREILHLINAGLTDLVPSGAIPPGSPKSGEAALVAGTTAVRTRSCWLVVDGGEHIHAAGPAGGKHCCAEAGDRCDHDQGQDLAARNRNCISERGRQRQHGD